MKHLNKGIFCASLLWSTIAFGDAMPACPPGETVQMNPVKPGAFHHAGGKCVPDPTYKPQPEATQKKPEPTTPDAAEATKTKADTKTGGCAVSPESSSLALLSLVGLSLLLASQRKRAK